MEISIYTAVLVGLLYIPASYFFNIYRNYRAAQKLGLPIIINPLSPISSASFLFSIPAHNLLKRVGLGNVLREKHLGWEYQEKARPFVTRNCSAFVSVTPDANWLSLADPGALMQIFQAERKTGDFGRPAETIRMLDVFGPNISSASGSDWQRMRKITAASFNESTNRVVWKETMQQGSAMLAHWLAAGRDGVRSTATDTRNLALNVLLHAGFGKEYHFEGSKTSAGDETGSSNKKVDFRESIRVVLQNAILIIAIGTERLPRVASLFGGLRPVATAVAGFQQYMRDTLEQGRKQGRDAESRMNLLDSLVRATYEDNQLTQPELFGNMFVYTFGGHDSTAHSLAFTFVELSIHPEVQEWMREEILAVFPSDDPQTWSYDDFPKLKRTFAVQLETMRIHNPLLGLVKGVPPGRTATLTLDDGNRTLHLPPRTYITVNLNGVHTHPRYWGEDALEWRPQRWVWTDADGVEQLLVPDKGVYLPWSDGIRSCPGRKFGQVEHVALMATVFRAHQVAAKKEERGESDARTRERIEAVIADSGWALNIKMLHPERAGLVWSRC